MEAGVYVHFLQLHFLFNIKDFQAVSVLQSIHPGEYHVTIVSPDTFTTFTPLLPCKSVAIFTRTLPEEFSPSAAAVGTVSVRSLVESLRKIIARLHGQLINGRAVDLVMSDRLLEVETMSATGEHRNFYLPCGCYHRLNTPMI